MQVIDASNADIHQAGFIGGFFIRQMPVLNKGETHEGHEHYIDHLTNVVRGAVRIEWENKHKGTSGTLDILVPCRILIKADTWHKFTALEDSTFWECWFSEAEAEKVYNGEKMPWHLEKPSDV